MIGQMTEFRITAGSIRHEIDWSRRVCLNGTMIGRFTEDGRYIRSPAKPYGPNFVWVLEDHLEQKRRESIAQGSGVL